jgi:hypothetical protein
MGRVWLFADLQLDSKILFLYIFIELFPFNTGKKKSLCIQSLMNITLIFVHNFPVETTCEFSLCYKIILFNKVEISRNNKKIKFKFFFLSIVIVWEGQRYKTCIKLFNFRIKLGMFQKFISILKMNIILDNHTKIPIGNVSKIYWYFEN